MPIQAAESGKRTLEEVVVTAERRESTVSDTAISITALDGQLIEDFGLRNQEDLQNYIPATTIQPYDIAIRGVGRVFRALGGDPGVSTYFDGGYSEDFGIASTEGGLYDIERIEVLRGPQGTLYGRNGIGGAVNFVTNKQSHDFSAEIRSVVGSYSTAEAYGYINGSLIEDVLAARATFVTRDRDGTIEELGIGEDQDAYGDKNLAIALRLTPTDNLTIDLRGNDRDYNRVISAAQGAGAIVVSEAGGMLDEVTGGKRNTSAMVFGWRPVDTSVACASLADRTNPLCTIQGQDVFTFGGRTAQRLTPGIDPTSQAFALPNFAYGWDQNLANATYIGDGTSLPDLEGSDLRVASNGFNDEKFLHNNGTLNVAWDVTDWLTIKYIGAYTDYLYTRVTEDDRSSNVTDLQFHANQENENFQHEIQFFADFGENVTLTAGWFYYENQIDQRLDFWSPGMERFSAAADMGATAAALSPDPTDAWLTWQTARAVYNTSDDPNGYEFFAGVTSEGEVPDYTEANAITGAALGTNPIVPLAGASAFGLGGYQIGWNSARDVGCGIANLAGIVTFLGGAISPLGFNDPSVKAACELSGPWMGDTAGFAGGNAPSGPKGGTEGTSFIWNTENRTEAYAVYAQMEWQVNDTWALTLGGRYAKDDKFGFENLYLYREEELTTANLFAYNVATGALNADGTPTGEGVIRFRGIPFAQSFYRALENSFDETNWRINIDYTPNDDALIYLSATTGYRAGGFNLGYFSATPTYDPETVLAYELGYKATLLDGAMQLNASIFSYDYEDVHLQFVGNSFIGASTSVRNMESARNKGFELEYLWAATDALTIGYNYSYTSAKYTSELVDPETGTRGLVDNNDPYRPDILYSAAERATLVNGRRLQRVPETKFAAFGTYAMDIESGRLEFSSAYSMTGDVCFDVACGILDRAKPWSRWDARVTWTNDDERLSVAAYANNILNEIGIRNMDDENIEQNYLRSVVPTLPRMYGLEVRYRMGAL